MNKTQLRKRLNEARSMLLKKYKDAFTKRTVDFEGKRMVSDCGRYALRWIPREWNETGTIEFVTLEE